VLIAGRILGGLGAGAGLVIGSAIIRDLYTGHQAARLQATRVLVLGVSPILAPIIGAAVIAVAPWRTIFWIGAAVGLASAALLFLIPETHPAATRKANRQPGGALSVYGRLLADRRFMGIAFGAALAQAGFIAYIAGSSFVFITVNHLPPWAYSLVFGVYGVSFIGGAQFVPQLMRRFRTENLILTGMSIQAVCGVLMTLAALTHHASLIVLCPLLLLFLASSGLIGTPSMVLALREHGAVAGTASGLLSFMQSGGGALGSGLVASFANGTAMPMTGVMAGCAAGAVMMGLFAFSRPPQAALGIGAPP
jgi:DHA1 family bicyclomycin/chloramphenicol resistance-like MFS transporter